MYKEGARQFSKKFQPPLVLQCFEQVRCCYRVFFSSPYLVWCLSLCVCSFPFRRLVTPPVLLSTQTATTLTLRARDRGGGRRDAVLLVGFVEAVVPAVAAPHAPSRGAAPLPGGAGRGGGHFGATETQRERKKTGEDKPHMQVRQHSWEAGWKEKEFPPRFKSPQGDLFTGCGEERKENQGGKVKIKI